MKQNKTNEHMYILTRFTIPERDESLLRECIVYTFRAGGKGGQHVNKNETAVRLRHCASGITVSCQRERSQYLNKKICVERLRKRLEALTVKPKKRIPTKTPKRVTERRKKQKYQQSIKKQNRKNIIYNMD